MFACVGDFSGAKASGSSEETKQVQEDGIVFYKEDQRVGQERHKCKDERRCRSSQSQSLTLPFLCRIQTLNVMNH
jgi:hypothetical protein